MTPKKPTHVLATSGAFKKNPQRALDRMGDAHPTGDLGPMVEKLNELEAACWERLVAIAPPGVLKNSDEAVVELAARLWAKVKMAKATAAETTIFLKSLQQIGLTPVARSAVHVRAEDEPNEFRDV